MAERQVIKEKYRKRGLFDFLHFTLPRDPSPGRLTVVAGLSSCLLFTISPHAVSLSPHLCLLLPQRALIPCFWKFLRLFQCSCFCFDALSFTRVQRRGTRPCQWFSSLPGCGWEIEEMCTQSSSLSLKYEVVTVQRTFNIKFKY